MEFFDNFPDATYDEWLVYKEKLESSLLQIAKFFTGNSAPNHREYTTQIERPFIERLNEQFSDNANRFLAYHCIVGSTINFEQSKKLDFPPPFSVLTFCETIIQKYIRPADARAPLKDYPTL